MPRTTLEAATAPYRRAGRFAWHFARGKLGGDPAFGLILASDWIGPGTRVLDLGCGQGLLASLLDVAGRDCRVHGIELMAADVERAERSLFDTIARGNASFVRGDIRDADFGRADVAVILDVLHYINTADQQRVLERLRDALAPDGLLLLRVGDADAGLPFQVSNWVDRTVTFVRGHRLGALYCRPLSAWVATLESLGFRVRTVRASQGTPFANVLLEARSTPLPRPDLKADASADASADARADTGADTGADASAGTDADIGLDVDDEARAEAGPDSRR